MRVAGARKCVNVFECARRREARWLLVRESEGERWSVARCNERAVGGKEMEEVRGDCVLTCKERRAMVMIGRDRHVSRCEWYV